MHFIQILSLLACAQVTIANPILVQSRAKSGSSGASSTNDNASSPSNTPSSSSQSSNSNPPTQDSVQRAADNFQQDAGIVSNAMNVMTSMTDQDTIKATALRAFDAETDEDNQRAVLIAAAGTSGAVYNRKIVMYTPTVLDGLDAISKDPSPASVQQNVQMMEAARNPNILPSITELSNRALDAMGLDQTAPNLPKTTGSSNADSSNSTNSTNNNASSNQSGNNAKSGKN